MMKKLLNKGVKVLKEDPLTGLIAVYKPYLLKSHPNKSIDNESLLICEYDHNNECYIDNENNTKIFLLNRLDSTTSGVILLSTNSITSKVIKKEFSKRTVIKNYHALVFGTEDVFKNNKTLKWCNNIIINKNNNDKLRASASILNNNIEAISYVNLIKKIDDDPNVLLINLRPTTGFTHQLRIQCGLNGLPIVNDKIYGNFNLNKIFNQKKNMNYKKRLYLFSKSIELNYIIDNEQYEFKYELPEDYKNWN
jgi:23S rRNA-/tRNA-specific pseudouridylate synthase